MQLILPAFAAPATKIRGRSGALWPHIPHVRYSRLRQISSLYGLSARKRIPYGTKLPVSLSQRQVELVTDHTFADASAMQMGVVDGEHIAFRLSLDEIESTQGHVAAGANHTKDPKLKKELDRLWLLFQQFLDSYDDQADP